MADSRVILEKSPLRRCIDWLSSHLFSGLFITSPIVLTIWIISLFYQWINGPFDRIIRKIIKHNPDHFPLHDFFVQNYEGTIPGAGFILTIALFIIIGVLTRNFVGQQIIHLFDQVLIKLPLVGSIYNGLKQAAQTIQNFGNDDTKEKFRRVVYMQLFPGNDARLLGFVTSEFQGSDGVTYCNVFVPHAPSPLTGFLFVQPAKSLQVSEITVEQASKLIVSCGLVPPVFNSTKVELQVRQPIDTTQSR
jgi:uncharacterized membrane protein